MSTSKHETEIKLAVKDARSARRLLREAGFTVSRRRVFEANTVFDTPDQLLRNSSSLLRIRQAGGVTTITYKGVPEPGAYKSREELELTIDNAPAMVAIVERLGFGGVFRYEKYRTEFRLPERAGVAMLDETPVGVYLELEHAALDRPRRPPPRVSEERLYHRQLRAHVPGLVRRPGVQARGHDIRPWITLTIRSRTGLSHGRRPIRTA